MSEVKEETKKELPERKKTFKIEGNEYDVEFPDTGKLIEIEILKTSLSRNQYGGLIDNGTYSSAYARNLIDMTAVFTVLFPDLKKDMNVKAIRDLHPLESKKLLKVYIKEVNPWLSDWFMLLNEDDDE